MSVRNLTELRDSCKGDLFIVASGPSAREFPLQRYAHLPMMAVNGSIRLFTEAGVAPYFYLCDDSSFVRNRLPLLLEALAVAQNLALSPRVIDSLLEREPHALDGRSVYHFQRVNRSAEDKVALGDRRFAWLARKDIDIECQFSLFRQKPNRIGFSRNLGKGYFSNRTVPYAGVQLAHHLGFSRVFMVGLDLSSGAGRFYEQGSDAVPSRLDGDYEDYILPCFQLMSERVVGPHFKVYNLSAGSRLPGSIVPKIGYDELDRLLACS
ncbi:conserved hypothetical protein [Pseudomonas sp. 8Z]|uniref:lipopolysaccharide core biosynthesis protein n=1 Tax=Pseudomonas sp. 8Z TaxID=2653166 RepID=UPI0012EF39EB|nr:lipopolysaccharide core biosynthesis protein [Pseudomonas sp. 8Z]VXC14878.1 conserved hypothetical protein [Pseudomonas sp. 8Z]